MRSLPACLALILATTSSVVRADASPITALRAESFPARVLAEHNSERALFGTRPLSWDPQLAMNAAAYAAEMSRSGQWGHSPKAGRPGQSENLWMGTRGSFSIEQMLGGWLEERNWLIPGTFPSVSRSGNWLDVAHYTQMISRRSTRVGCGMASSARYDYLVCRYSPVGNVDGMRVP